MSTYIMPSTSGLKEAEAQPFWDAMAAAAEGGHDVAVDIFNRTIGASRRRDKTLNVSAMRCIECRCGGGTHAPSI
jgi:hypothetical protein